MTGRCPKCGQFVYRLIYHSVDASSLTSPVTWRAITLQCPHCYTVLGAQLDPIAIKSDTVRETAAEVKRQLR